MISKRFPTLVLGLVPLWVLPACGPAATSAPISAALVAPWEQGHQVRRRARPGGARSREVVVGARPAPRYRSSDIPGGITCLLRLQHLGIAHQTLDRRFTHVVTPVALAEPVVLGGVRYRPLSRRVRFVCDCRLALALHRAGATLRALGVTEARYSNTYRRPSGRRLSRHTMGLAIDVHRVLFDSAVHDVRHDYRAGYQPETCREAPAPLNALACVLARRGLLDRVLTPDTDAAHHDHFHWAIVSIERRRNPARRRASPIVVD